MSMEQVSVSLELPIEGRFGVVSCRVAEGISEHCEAEIHIASNEDLDFEPALSQPAVLRILLDGVEARRWTLRVQGAGFDGIEMGSRRYFVSLRDNLWFLRLVKATRKFRNTSGQEIVTTILGEGNVPASWALTRPTFPRNYCVQYRETNLDFVLRLLEFEGIYYSFDEDGILLLADRSPASPPVEGQSYFELVTSGDALTHDVRSIYALRRGARVASGKATVHDYDWKKPSADLRRSAEAGELTELEVYDYPVGYREGAEGEYLAQIRLEALRVPARFVEGESTVMQFAPARTYTFGALAGPAFAGEHLITRVEHRYTDPRYTEEAGGGGPAAAPSYANSFQAIPRDVPFRPPLRTPYPVIAGAHTVMVRGPEGEEIHTDSHGRFKAQFHWDREAKGTDEDSRWVRMLQEPQTSMTLARVGWEMSVGYIDGDPDRPVGLARNINGVMIPTYAQPSNRSRMTIRTQTYPGGGGYNELRLEDVAGAMHFDMRAERDYAGVIKRNRVESIGGNHIHTARARYGRSVGRNQTVSIGGNFTTDCTGMHAADVTGDRIKNVTGDETIKAGEYVKEDVGGDDTETVGGDRTTTADAGVTRMVNKGTLTRTIGADYTVKAEGSIQGKTGALTETITGSKMTTASSAGIQQGVTGSLTLTVDGTAVRIGKENVSLSANATSLTVEQSALLKGDHRLELHGKTIEIVATSKLALSQGGLSIELTPGGVTLKGDVKLDGGGAITVTGNAEHLTK